MAGPFDRFSSWLTRKTVARPYCVCLSSLGVALFFTLLILGGLALGLLEFALDTSPASFKVTNDPVADRGDAFAVFREFTTGTLRAESHAGLWRWWGRDVRRHCGLLLDLELVWDSPVFEARVVSPDEDGVEGANVFAEDAIATIAALEADIRALEGFPSVCVRKPEFRNYTGETPLLSHCEPVFTVTPLDLARPSNNTVPVPPNTRCCTCNGSSPSNGDSCVAQAALCEEETGENRLIFRIPDGEGAPGQAEKVLSQLHRALSCDDPVLSGAAVLNTSIQTQTSLTISAY